MRDVGPPGQVAQAQGPGPGPGAVRRDDVEGGVQEEWGAGRRRLQERGLPAADGTATDTGRELRAKAELHTDEEAAAPWRALGETGCERLAELPEGPWLEVIGSGMPPVENTLGIGKGRDPPHGPFGPPLKGGREGGPGAEEPRRIPGARLSPRQDGTT
ncbi:helix-turn-helix domain-containing protein [Streptomyces pratensis]|uniref:helix-turn-helix domain-containing protein n=1 Tax=Streptomyces pratensis TaxID=1169025 RepID=UPI003AFAD72C